LALEATPSPDEIQGPQNFFEKNEFAAEQDLASRVLVARRA
jgi:hypothetical protein